MSNPIYYPLALSIQNFVKQGNYDLEFTMGDYGQQLIFQLIDSQGNPFNATGLTVVLQITSTYYPLYVNTGTTAWVALSTGIFSYTPSAQDFSLPGNFAVRAILSDNVTSSSLLLLVTDSTQ